MDNLIFVKRLYVPCNISDLWILYHNVWKFLFRKFVASVETCLRKMAYVHFYKLSSICGKLLQIHYKQRIFLFLFFPFDISG